MHDAHISHARTPPTDRVAVWGMGVVLLQYVTGDGDVEELREVFMSRPAPLLQPRNGVGRVDELNRETPDQIYQRQVEYMSAALERNPCGPIMEAAIRYALSAPTSNRKPKPSMSGLLALLK